MNTTPISLGHLQSKNKKRVLIVDNDEAIQQILQGVLEDAGFDTRTMWSGYEALALLESRSVDVLLVDNHVPDLHFHDFLKRVGRLPIQPWIVVMQAAARAENHVRQYALLGASASQITLNRGPVLRGTSGQSISQQSQHGTWGRTLPVSAGAPGVRM